MMAHALSKDTLTVSNTIQGMLAGSSSISISTCEAVMTRSCTASMTYQLFPGRTVLAVA